MKQKVLVTGADGQLGSELRELSAAYTPYEFIFANRALLPLDEPEMLRARLDEINPQYIINCAAYTAVDKAESEPELAGLINADAPRVMAEYCAEYGSRLIHVSTDYVFSGDAAQPYRTNDNTGPQTVYGSTKLAGEEAVLATGAPAVIIRTAWVYSTYGKNFVKTMLRLMRERPSISVVDDQRGTPTYAADLASAILVIIAGSEWKPGVYHYSNEGEISWYDFAVAIRDLSGLKTEVRPISSREFPTPAKRPQWSVLDKSAIRSAYRLVIPGWKASLQQCLQKMEQGS